MNSTSRRKHSPKKFHASIKEQFIWIANKVELSQNYSLDLKKDHNSPVLSDMAMLTCIKESIENLLFIQTELIDKVVSDKQLIQIFSSWVCDKVSG